MADITKAFSVNDGLSLRDVVGLFYVTGDPSTGLGEVAPTGSVVFSTNGYIYQKINSGNTDWARIARASELVDQSLYYHNNTTTQTVGNSATTMLFGTAVKTNAFATYSAGVFTFAQSGQYQIIVEGTTNTTAILLVSPYAEWELQKNNTLIAGGRFFSFHGSNNSPQTATATIVENFNVSDTFRVRMRSSDAVNLTTSQHGSRVLIRKLVI